MTNVICLQSRLQCKKLKYNKRLAHVVGLILARNQSIVVGSCKPQERYDELKEMFSDAELQILPMGIGIKNGKNK